MARFLLFITLLYVIHCCFVIVKRRYHTNFHIELGLTKVRVFGSGTRKNPKPELRGQVGSG